MEEDKVGVISKQILDEVIENNAHKIVKRDWLDPVALLKAIAYVESSYGENPFGRFEPAFYRGGRYWQKHFDILAFLYGLNVAGSFGPFQILYFTAKRFGFDGNPLDLQTASVSIQYVIAYINEIIEKRGARSVEEIADAYNSGSFRDKYVPKEYIKKFMEAYNKFKK